MIIPQRTEIIHLNKKNKLFLSKQIISKRSEVRRDEAKRSEVRRDEAKRS